MGRKAKVCKICGDDRYEGTNMVLCYKHDKLFKISYRKEVSLSVEELESLIPEDMICHLCGETMLMEPGRHPKTMVFSPVKYNAMICLSCNLKIFNCTVCGKEISNKSRTLSMCDKHHKLYCMINTARERNKAVPTMEQLEEMIPEDLICEVCGKTMLWYLPRTSNRRKDVISLQHWDSGRLSMICYSCNCRHANIGIPEDMFLKVIWDKENWCNKCKQVLPLNRFSPKKRGIPYCIECSRVRERQRYKERKLRIKQNDKIDNGDNSSDNIANPTAGTSCT